MALIKPKPGVAYLGSTLWVPKTHYVETQVGARLTYANPRAKEKVVAYASMPHHWSVPRNFMTPESLALRGIELVDARPTKYPSVSLRSSVVLDSKEPAKSYQRDGSAALLAAPMDAILCLRCGAGKTAVSLHSAAQLGVPVLVVVDDRGLARQWIRDIEKFYGLSRKQIGQVYDGRMDWEREVTIATVQTLATKIRDGALPFEMTRHFGVVIMDEAHMMGAPFFNTAIPPFPGRRWGLSATPQRHDEFDPLLSYTIGDVAFTYLEPELRPKVVFRRLDTTLNLSDKNVIQQTHDRANELHLGMLFKYFSTREDRIQKIVKDVSDAVGIGRQCLVLTHSRDMCELLEGRFAGGGATHGGVKGDRHFEIVEDSNPLIAIMKRGKQALDKASLDTVFAVEPFTKAGVLQQVMGRALRPSPGKAPPTIIIYEDVNIKALRSMCNKLRATLSRWPANQGGAIPHITQKAI